MPHDLASVRHVVLDLDGTIYRGDRLFDGDAAVSGPAAKLGHRLHVPDEQHVAQQAGLRRQAAEARHRRSESEIYTPADSTIAHLREQLPQVTALAVLGTPSLCRQFEEAGFHVTGMSRRPSSWGSIRR